MQYFINRPKNPIYTSSESEFNISMTKAFLQILNEYTSLENFWKRYNKVNLDKLALEKEKQDLLNENTQLRAVLKQYLNGTSRDV